MTLNEAIAQLGADTPAIKLPDGEVTLGDLRTLYPGDGVTLESAQEHYLASREIAAAKAQYNEVLNLDDDTPLPGGACNLDGPCESCQ